MDAYEQNIHGRTILITGGAGAIGSNLTKAVAELGAKTVVVLDDLSAGYEWNVLGQEIAPNADVQPGYIDTIDTPLQTPEFGDPTMKVRQLVAITDGVTGFLEQLGLDRGVPRATGEPTEQYRARVRTLPDTVSFDAVRRAVESVLAPLNISFQYIETFLLSYQSCFDAPNTLAPIFVYDDPRPQPPRPFMNRWLDENEFRGAFIIVVPRLAAITERGMVYDDPEDIQGNFFTNLGRRAQSAYDSPNDTTVVYAGVYDGEDQQQQALMQALFFLLQQTKAAGVSAILEQEGQ